MDYLKSAAQLGEALLKTSQFEELEAARTALEQDVPAQVLVQSLEEIKEELASFRERGEEVPGETMAKVQKINERMTANQALKR